MNSRKFIQFSAALVIFSVLIAKSSQATVTFADGNELELPDEPQTYCGLELRKATRIYCREAVIEKFKKKEVVRNFQKPSRCGVRLVDRCCRTPCTLTTFVQFCPYRYIRRWWGEREWIIFISGAGAPSAEVGDLCSLDDPLLLGDFRAS